jgi:hypothetical protein
MWTGFNWLNIIMNSVEGREFLDQMSGFVKKMFLVDSPNYQILFRSMGDFLQFFQGNVRLPFILYIPL